MAKLKQFEEQSRCSLALIFCQVLPAQAEFDNVSYGVKWLTCMLIFHVKKCGHTVCANMLCDDANIHLYLAWC